MRPTPSPLGIAPPADSQGLGLASVLSTAGVPGGRQAQLLDSLAVRLEEQIDLLSSRVPSKQSSAQVGRVRTELQQLREEFLEFARRAELTANVQRAEIRIAQFSEQIDREFGRYRETRRMAAAMAHGRLSPEAALDEDVMTGAPRYWLAAATVALSAWAADDRALRDRATEEAVSRSADRSSLYFALVLRRRGRQAAALRWLASYLRCLDLSALGHDFPVVLDAVYRGAFGVGGIELLHGAFGQWRETLRGDKEAQSRLIHAWQQECESVRALSLSTEFPNLSAVSPQWPALDGVLSSARAKRVVIDTYAVPRGSVPASSGRLDAVLDEVLERLVSEYTAEELPLLRALDVNRSVVEHDGDLNAAARLPVADHAGAPPQRLETILAAVALNPAALDVSSGVQQLALTTCLEWFEEARDRFEREYRTAVPAEVQVKLELTRPPQPAASTIPDWTGSFTSPQAELEHALSEHWDRHGHELMASSARRLKALLVLLAVLVVAILFVFGWAAGVIALAAASVVGTVTSVTVRRRCGSVRELLSRSKEKSIRQLRAAAAELTDWWTEFRAAESAAGGARPSVEPLTLPVHRPSPAERPATAAETWYAP
ncbi:hypothetical protein ACWGDT_41125 [Streptomyces avermitilis]